MATMTAGAKSCSECTGKICVLEGNSELAGGTMSVLMTLCNYDAANAPKITFSLGWTPTCDTTGALVPQVKSIAVNSTNQCSKSDPCTVNVSLQSPLDWAIALKTKNNVNKLMASIDKQDAVQVGTFGNDSTPLVTASDNEITPCATNIAIRGSRFSSLDACNSAQVCRGPTDAKSCVVNEAGSTLLNSSAEATFLSMNKPFSCDATTNNSIVYVQLKIGDADLSPMTKVAKVVGLTSSSAISLYPTYIGRSNAVLTGDVCAENMVFRVNDQILSATTSLGNTTIKFTTPLASNVLNLNYTVCGASTLRLFQLANSSMSLNQNLSSVFPSSSPLTNVVVSGSGFVNDNLTCIATASKGNTSFPVTLSDCKCTAINAYNLSVSCLSSLKDLVGYTISLNINNATNTILGIVVASSQGSASVSNTTGSSQSSNSAGLSGGWIAGICIVAIAIIGFFVECFMHKKQFRAKQMQQAQYMQATGTVA
ncbi:hypothetical protein THRCLA_02955 [Thraustotheca clavata]|uniref:Transmembrane protein n=1 Tax=Thraustotheca clavata TaxID=74557 RepID=A0A1W0A3M6_9STRA|nr:hypothetical protein THRCLA_02955 [Thraustotheca clavata]